LTGNFDKGEGESNNTAADSRIPFNSWKILAILSCISIMVLYAETMLIPAIPHIIGEFSITYGTSSWILSSYLIAGAVSVPVAGKLSDMYGRKKILLLVLIIYTTGVVGAAFSVDIYSLLISRTVQGVGMSVFPIVFAIVQGEFPRNKIEIAQGTLASMFAFGGVLGLVVGGNIIEYFGWKATFYSVAPVAVLLMIIIIKQVHVKDSSQGSHTLIQQRKQFFYRNEEEGDDDDDTAEKRTNLPNTVKKSLARLDIKGVTFLAITITSFLSALTLVQSSSPSSSPSPPSTENTIPHDWQPAVPVFLGSASLAVFIIVEKRSSSPIIDFKLISKKPVLLSNMLVIIWGICTFAIFQTIPHISSESSSGRRIRW
jgi:MFS family permease